MSVENELIKFDEFLKNEIYVENNNVFSNGNQLQTAKEKLKSEIKERKLGN